MNIDYVLHHISSELYTMVRTWEGPLTEETEPTCICTRSDLKDHYLTFPAFAAYARQFPTALYDPDQCPLLFSVGNDLVYAYTASTERSCLIGPIRLATDIQLNLHAPEIQVTTEDLGQVFTCELYYAVAQVLLLHNVFHENWVDRDTVVVTNCVSPDINVMTWTDYSRLVFERQELDEPHNPYEQELREVGSIEQGDVEMLKQSMNEAYTGKLGILADDELRNIKNLCIVVITLASRAAMRGGLNPEQAYSMSDAYIQSIERITEPNAAYSLVRQYEIEYARLVAEIKAGHEGRDRRPNMWTEQCKDYIFQHLHERLSTRDVAEHLHLNANYLSEIFKECEGMTITEFILKEKVRLTRNLLTYSPYSYIEIATYLGFSSQSHLGKVFKRYTGMTLREYRERYGQGSPAEALAEGERISAEGTPWRIVAVQRSK